MYTYIYLYYYIQQDAAGQEESSHTDKISWEGSTAVQIDCLFICMYVCLYVLQEEDYDLYCMYVRVFECETNVNIPC